MYLRQHPKGVGRYTLDPCLDRRRAKALRVCAKFRESLEEGSLSKTTKAYLTFKPIISAGHHTNSWVKTNQFFHHTGEQQSQI